MIRIRDVANSKIDVSWKGSAAAFEQAGPHHDQLRAQSIRAVLCGRAVDTPSPKTPRINTPTSEGAEHPDTCALRQNIWIKQQSVSMGNMNASVLEQTRPPLLSCLWYLGV